MVEEIHMDLIDILTVSYYKNEYGTEKKVRSQCH